MSHILAAPLWSSESCGGDRRESESPTNSGLIAASHSAQGVKNLSAMQETQETWVRSLGQEDPWRRAWQPTPAFLPGESPWTEEPGVLLSSFRVQASLVTEHGP